MVLNVLTLKKRWWVAIQLILIGIASAVNYLAWSIYAYPTSLTPVQADAAIVLGAAAWGERPSPVFRERINYALELYRTGLVSKLIFTGGEADPGEPAEAVVAQRYASEHGVPETDTLIETRSHSTRENLYYAQQIARQNNLTRILIVSDPLHLKRAVLIAQDLGMDAYPAPTPTTRYQSFSSQLSFLIRETYYYIAYLIRRPFMG
ncbi:MAG: YdcF family protein [Chloroflexi bacterium]|nr:YdcF family protein [Chloroflexota bacterium]